jgi:hypothetical protein
MGLGYLLVELGTEAQRAGELLAHAYSVFLGQLGPDHPLTRQLATLFQKPSDDVE